MREALFGILAAMGAIEDAHVLDLYAGTGALSLEALSRGAANATLVESSRDALAALRANVAVLGLEHCTRVVAADIRRALRRLVGGPFDLVLADPPWSLVESGEAVRVLAEVVEMRLLDERALVVLEHAARTVPPDIGGLVREQSRSYGDAALTFYKPAILGAPRSNANARTPLE